MISEPEIKSSNPAPPRIKGQEKISKIKFFKFAPFHNPMKQHVWQNVNYCWLLNTPITFYVETSGGQSSNLYLSAVHFFNTTVN
jgi:hypothetical protein